MKRGFIISLTFISFIMVVRSPRVEAVNQKYPAGIIIDSIKCENNPGFSYSIYLPSAYDDTTRWPVVFVFDPAARSRSVLNGFLPAAEKSGYIIACSDYSRNGLPWDKLFPAITCMLNDVENKFLTDTARIYTSGFSGGSRVASAVAIINPRISGVIACGAGFPSNFDVTGKPSFDFIGLIGNQDMNYYEMIDLDQELANFGTNVELRVFEGGHKWPDPDLLSGAVEWLDLQAMKNGNMEADREFIDSQFVKYKNNAEKDFKKGNLTESARQYKYIVKNFPENISTGEIENILDSLIQSKEYERSVREKRKIREREDKEIDFMGLALSEMVKNGSEPDSLPGILTGQINKLKRMKRGRDINTRDMSVRLLMRMNMWCYETGMTYYNFKDFRAASICFGSGLIIEPENISLLILQSKALALNKNTDKSLLCLEKAVRLGFKDMESLKNDHAFDLLKYNPRFRKIVSYKSSAPGDNDPE